MRIFILFVTLMFVSCQSDDEILRISSSPQILSDSIYAIMPGDLLMNDNYLVWTDPLGDNYFFHVLDKSTGKEIGGMGKIGLGPGEFVSPLANRFFHSNELFINDVNKNVYGYLSIDSFLLNKEPFIELKLSENEKPLIRIEDDIYMKSTEDGSEDYFDLMTSGNKKTFGRYPIPKVKRHLGGYMVYDPVDKYLVNTSYDFPYMALYQFKNDNFELIWEKKTTKGYYEIERGEIVFNRKVMGQGDVCMSKDYIITLERDRKIDDTDESTVGRDISKCPQTVFLYDFESNLIKIVHLGMPVMRIVSNRQNNTLYVIGANPDYVLAKYEL